MVIVDDFQSYSTDEDLQAVWDQKYISSGETAFRSVGIEGPNQFIRVELVSDGSGTDVIHVENLDINETTPIDFSGKRALRFWLRADQNNPSTLKFQFRLIDADGENWGSEKLYPNDPDIGLDPAGEYVDLLFDNFTTGSTGGNGILDLYQIKQFWFKWVIPSTDTGPTSIIDIDDIAVIP